MSAPFALDDAMPRSKIQPAGAELDMVTNTNMHPLMNDTKWDELRSAMYELGPLSPKWRTSDVENGYLSEWDGEWFYHFRDGGYTFIHWVEIAVESEEQKIAVLAKLAKIRVPGEITEGVIRVFGYAEPGADIEHLTTDIHPTTNKEEKKNERD